MRSEPPLFIHNSATDKPAADYLNSLFLEAAQAKIPDIHLQWIDSELHVRLRIDGNMREHGIVEPAMAKMVDAKIRARANMDLSQHQSPIDGRITLRFEGREAVGVRVSVVPSHGGQKIVCRLLDQSNAAMGLDDIKMPFVVDHTFREMIQEPQGLILVTGPTGSGKTTTLYASLNQVNDGTLNITTIENPVEYVVPGFVQLNVTPYLTFQLGLRALLRQDPDVILIGEIRDEETAEIAIQAASTGHLVFATLHANNASQAIPRLLDLKIDRQTLASTLIGVLAQRLVPTLSATMQHVWSDVTDIERHWLKKNNLPLITGKIPRATAKDAFVGKRPIIELIKNDKFVRQAIINGEGELGVLNAAARQSQFDTLGQAAVRMVTTGATTMDRVQRLIKDDSVMPRVRRIGDVLLAQGLITFAQATEAAEAQLRYAIAGKVRKLGQVLIDSGIVSQDDIATALGFTEGAVEFLGELAMRRVISYKDLQPAVELWRTERHQESLFELIIEQNLITKDRLYEEVFNADGRDFDAGLANDCDGSGSGAVAAL